MSIGLGSAPGALSPVLRPTGARRRLLIVLVAATSALGAAAAEGSSSAAEGAAAFADPAAAEGAAAEGVIVARGVGGFQQAAPSGAQSRFLRDNAAEEDYTYPMCGYSKTRADENPVQRFCLRQCRVERNGQVRPTFEEWEKYCRDTSSMDPWDQECMAYLSCTYGCEIWGGKRKFLLDVAAEDRYSFLTDSLADMYAAGITQETRCELEKCHSYCARKELPSCRESQYQQQCRASNPDLYGCSVDCNDAQHRRLGSAVLLLLMCYAADVRGMYA